MDNEEFKPLRVAIYTRVSTEEQGKPEKPSLPKQQAACRAWAEEQGHVVIGVYEDNGVSGGAMERPQLQEALEAARRREYDVLLAKCMDRLTRDTDHGGHIVTVLRANSVELRLVDEDFEQTAIGKLMRTISTWRGEEEREKLRSRALYGRLGLAERGKVSSSSPAYGYRHDPILDEKGKRVCKLVIDEAEALQIRRMAAVYLDGSSICGIATLFNEQRVPTKLNGRRGWSAEQVRRILVSESYAGTGHANRKQKVGKKTVIRSRDEWKDIEYPAIIDRATYDAVQARMANNKPFNGVSHGEARHLLAGIVRCWCGQQLSCANERHKRPVYRCAGQIKRRTPCRTPIRVPGAALDSAVWDAVVTACRNPALWTEANATYDRQTGRLLPDAEAHIAEVASKLETAREERTNLLRFAAKAGLTADDRELTAELAAYEQSIDSWERELARLRARTTDFATATAARERAEAFALEIAPVLDRELSFAEKQELVRAMVKRVWLSKDNEVTIEAALPYLETVRATTHSRC